MKLVAHRSLMVAVMAFSLVLPLLAHTSTAFACTCEPPNLQRQFDAADVAFTGEVESVTAADEGTLRVEFEAEKFWKGQPTDYVVVYTANNSAACGMNFDEDVEYFVLASGAERLETNLCQYNVNMDDGSDADTEAIESLGEGQEPDDEDPPSQGGGDGDDPSDDGDGSGGSGDGDDPADAPGEEGESVASDVDPDALNVSAVVLSALVAAGAVVAVAGRK